MNLIYERCRPKRKYHRKLLCANPLGICTRDQCRCNYAEDLRMAAQGKKPRLVWATIDEEVGERLLAIK